MKEVADVTSVEGWFLWTVPSMCLHIAEGMNKAPGSFF